MLHNNEGNIIFDAEASNENLDIQEQRVLKSALLNSKDYFLTNGIISKDHLHKQVIGEGDERQVIYNEDFIIGEPLEVYEKDGVVRVKGLLYKDNPYAQKFINLLKEGSSRVKASIGGFLPIIKLEEKDGKKEEVVTNLLWNDLALTISPVNPTVSSAYIVKSLSSLQFVKALSAGYETDALRMQGGRALIPEDIGSPHSQKSSLEGIDNEVLTFLLEAEKGSIKTKKDITTFLSHSNNRIKLLQQLKAVYKDDRDLLRRILPMASKLESILSFITKSVKPKKKKEEEEDEEIKEPYDNIEDDLSYDEGEDENEEGEDFDEEDEGEVKKSLDASFVLSEISKSIRDLSKGQELLAKAIAVNYDQLAQILGTPNQKTSITHGTFINKGGFTARVPQKHRQFTLEDKKEITPLLIKSLKAKEISASDVTAIETQINKSIASKSYQITPNYMAMISSILKQNGVIA